MNMENISDRLIRSGIRFLKDLQEEMGTDKGLAVWDKMREAMGDEICGQVLFGIMKGHHGNTIRLVSIGEQKINAIKLVRECTGIGLKEAKDLVEGVQWNGKSADLDMTGIGSGLIDQYCRRFEEIGCRVQ